MIDRFFLAVKAFILYNDKILLLKESEKYNEGMNYGKYDVPGGRINFGERYDCALLREIKEETGLNGIVIKRPFFVNEWRPEVKGEKWQIIGIFFNCRAFSDKVILSEEHSEYIWIDPKDYKKYEIIDNLIPVFESFIEYYQ